jgi:hypothetical protein
VTAYPPRIPKSDMARVTPDKPPQTPTLQVDVGSWTRPSEEDRALIRAAFERNGAHDLADALGLSDDGKPDRPAIDAGPKTVPCPTCGALAGNPCRTSTSRVLGGYHTARQEAA